MMQRVFFALLLGVVVFLGDELSAQEAPKKIKALLITGGCCHDYAAQKNIIAEGISARAHVEWKIIHQGGSTTDTKIPFYENPNWAEGFDVIVHNECFAQVTDPEWVQRVLAPHKAGLPGLVIHCAMHCYRDKTDEWFRFVGVTSHRHGAHYPFEVINLKRSDPILEDFGASWTTPQGELYLISKVWPGATPLAHARSRDSKKDEVCIWTNSYGDARVFGTTIGHHNETMADPVYLDMITRGLLWSVDKLGPRYLKKNLVRVNLARGKPVAASSAQSGRDAKYATDGNSATRWCAANGGTGHSLAIDLGEAEDLTGCRITWEFAERNYRYLLEGSEDGKIWQKLVDRRKSGTTDKTRKDDFEARRIRHLRLTVVGLPPGSWASIYEFEVFGHAMVEARSASRRKAGSAEKAGSREKARDLLRGVKAPAGFELQVFAAPPDVMYPTALAAAPTGELYVSVDLNSSLERKAGRGSIVRCVDEDGDGRADTFTEFARLESPRGLCYDNGSVYVIHQPSLSVYRDTDGDGIADESEILVEGIGFTLKDRPADHTSNGVRMGIDGWLYLAIGDFGFMEAVGKDGTHLQLRGGGIVRVRPDGTELELYARGTRNIYDLCLDPYLNGFTRDNTNDGGGWDIHLSHIFSGAHYGYPSLYMHFGEEIMPHLADYGGGSGTGGMYLQEGLFAAPFGDALYTCDWGRNKIYRHPLKAQGASFTAEQEDFLTIPRPTDMDVDGKGNLFVASWKGGQYRYQGPEVGYILRMRPEHLEAVAFPNLLEETDAELVQHLLSDSAVLRLDAQRGILSRARDLGGKKPALIVSLKGLITSDAHLRSRVAALFTLMQLQGEESHAFVRELYIDAELREFALRALADRLTQSGSVPVNLFLEGLEDRDPRVRMQALVGLARLGRVETAKKVLALTEDVDTAIRHRAVKTLVALEADEACIRALANSKPEERPHAGPQLALRELHSSRTVNLLLDALRRRPTMEVHRQLVLILIRLYYRDGEWRGNSWGTRPDTTGPYYQRDKWSETPVIERLLIRELGRADTEDARVYFTALIRHRVELPGALEILVSMARADSAFRGTAFDILAEKSELPESARNLLDASLLSAVEEPALRGKALIALSRQNGQSALDVCIRGMIQVSRSGDGSAEFRQAREQFLSSRENARRAAYFARLSIGADAEGRKIAFEVLVRLDQSKGVRGGTRKIVEGALAEAWTSSGAVSLIEVIGTGRHAKYRPEVEAQLSSENSGVREAAKKAMTQLQSRERPAFGEVAKTAPEVVIRKISGMKGKVRQGEALFKEMTCVNCHTVAKKEPLKGPYLGGISTRYSRKELATSVLQPSALVAQGFETHTFILKNGGLIEGFVVREAGDEVEVRNAQGEQIIIAKKKVAQRGKGEGSVMPNGLIDKLSMKEFASLISYLQSLPAE